MSDWGDPWLQPNSRKDVEDVEIWDSLHIFVIDRMLVQT